MENSIGDGRASAADGATDGVAGGAADGAAEVATDGAAEHLGGATERGDRRGPARGATAVIGVGGILLTGAVLAVLVVAEPVGVRYGLLVAVLVAAVVAGVLVAVRGLTGPADGPVGGVVVVRLAGGAALAGALLAVGAGLVVTGAVPAKPVLEVMVMSSPVSADWQAGGTDEAESPADGIPSGIPGGTGGLLVLHAATPGMPAGEQVRTDLYKTAGGGSTILTTRIGVVPGNGVAVVDIQVPGVTATEVTLQIDVEKRRCTAAIELSRIGARPSLTCHRRR